MSCKLKSYSCVTCHKRMKKDALRFLKGSQNRSLRHFLGRTFVVDIDEKDAVCNKCRQLYYSSNQTGKQVILTDRPKPNESVLFLPSYYQYRLRDIDMMHALFVQRNQENL